MILACATEPRSRATEGRSLAFLNQKGEKIVSVDENSNTRIKGKLIREN